MRACVFLVPVSSLDKALHSAGVSCGFVIFGTNLTNPLNELLLALQPVGLVENWGVCVCTCLRQIACLCVRVSVLLPVWHCVRAIVIWVRLCVYVCACYPM